MGADALGEILDDTLDALSAALDVTAPEVSGQAKKVEDVELRLAFQRFLNLLQSRLPEFRNYDSGEDDKSEEDQDLANSAEGIVTRLEALESLSVERVEPTMQPRFEDVKVQTTKGLAHGQGDDADTGGDGILVKLGDGMGFDASGNVEATGLYSAGYGIDIDNFVITGIWS